jgi:hypothetical protein
MGFARPLQTQREAIEGWLSVETPEASVTVKDQVIELAV